MRSCTSEYELEEAKDLKSALQTLSSSDSWRPIAGGTDLMVLFNSGLLPYRRLVSVRTIAELSQISVSDHSISIGAAVTYTAIQHHEVIRTEFPLLSRAAGWTGSIANQNRGTLGGNIANGSPAADSPPALLVYDAELEIASLQGRRRIPYADFHTGYKKMQLTPGELLRAVHLKRTALPSHQYARKVGARKAQAIAKVCFHSIATVDNGCIRDIRIALGSVAPFPVRCKLTEEMLRGQTITGRIIDAARSKISEEIQPIDDIRSTAIYRSRVSQNLLGEFLEQLL